MLKKSFKKNKFDRFDYFYFFIIVIYAAMAVPATKSMVRPHGGGLIAYIIPWGGTAIITLKHRVSFADGKLILVTSVYFLWVVLQIFVTERFYDGAFLFYGNILIAYVVVKIYDIEMFSLYEKYIVRLSCIAVLCWIMQVFVSDVFLTIMKATSIYDFSVDSTILANNVFFSMSNDGRYLGHGFSVPRNAGFSWEPGRYASMLIFAMFINLARMRFEIKKNHNFWILFIALVTTQSTTGYSALFLLFIYVIINKTKIDFTLKSFLVIIFLAPTIAVVSLLPFMGEKIKNLTEIDSERKNIELALKYGNNSGVIVPQRFTSMMFELMNIKDKPVFGYGVNPGDSYVQRKISSFISLTSGCLGVFSQFGVVLGFLVYFSLYKSSCFFAEYYRFNGKWLYFFTFIMLSVSYSFWQVPFYMSSWMFTMFNKKGVNLSQ